METSNSNVATPGYVASPYSVPVVVLVLYVWSPVAKLAIYLNFTKKFNQKSHIFVGIAFEMFIYGRISYKF